MKYFPKITALPKKEHILIFSSIIFPHIYYNKRILIFNIFEKIPKK
jgi:hypothetical protein